MRRTISSNGSHWPKSKLLQVDSCKEMLAFAQQHAMPDLKAKPGTAAPNRFYVYGVVARLALLAASLELERTDPDPEIY